MSLPASLLLCSRRHTYAALKICNARECSNDMRIIENPSIHSLKRGTGGRSSFNGIVATVFGATGFIGKNLINELGKCGTQVIVPYRCEPDDYEIKRLKLCGDLGQILFQPFDLRDPISIMKAIKYSNVVVNLIGCHFETRNFNYSDVHVKGAKAIASACREMGIERLIHVSALNVTDKPKAYFLPTPLDFLPSKLRGEEAVREEFPNATIIRPAVVFGSGDRFLRSLSDRHRRTFKSIPIYASGKKTVKQPVYARDVAKGIIAAMKNDESKGKTYQFVGPEKYLLHDIGDYVLRLTLEPSSTEEKLVHDARLDPYYIAKIILNRYMFGIFWQQPRFFLCFEQIEMESVTDEVDPSLPTLEDLGVTPTNINTVIEHLIRSQFLIRGEHCKDLVKYEPVPYPKPYNPFF